MTPSPRRGIRISDADRERAAARLQQALAEGRITLDELEERLAVVYAARYAADLLPPLEDLPGDAVVPVQHVAPPSPPRPTDRWCCARGWARCGVPGRGRCRPGSGCRASMGSVILDFCDTTLPPVVDVSLELGAGSARLLLPDGATADVDGMVSGMGTVRSKVASTPVPGPPALPRARPQRDGVGDGALPLPVRRAPLLSADDLE